MQNSETGNGVSVMASLMQKVRYLLLGSKKAQKKSMEIVETIDGFWVVEDNGYGLTYTGPYKREKDAKGVRTRMVKQRG